jgi:hypothetical protein
VEEHVSGARLSIGGGVGIGVARTGQGSGKDVQDGSDFCFAVFAMAWNAEAEVTLAEQSSS